MLRLSAIMISKKWIFMFLLPTTNLHLHYFLHLLFRDGEFTCKTEQKKCLPQSVLPVTKKLVHWARNTNNYNYVQLNVEGAIPLMCMFNWLSILLDWNQPHYKWWQTSRNQTKNIFTEILQRAYVMLFNGLNEWSRSSRSTRQCSFKLLWLIDLIKLPSHGDVHTHIHIFSQIIAGRWAFSF